MRKARRSASLRKARRSASLRTMYGGQANVGDTSMDIASQQSLKNGQGFQTFHASQHGGMAPVGDTGVLDSSLVQAARTGPTLQALQDAQAQGPDQAGGGRRRRRSLIKNTQSFFRRMFGSKRRARRSRRQRGGYAPVDAPDTLLPPDLASTALGGQNPEMAMAEDPNFLAPRGM